MTRRAGLVLLYLAGVALVCLPAASYAQAGASVAVPGATPSFLADLTAANNGDTAAQVRTGTAFLQGRGVYRNVSEAARLLQLASQSGSAEGKAWLGSMYLHGRGVTQDPSQALVLIQQSADANNPVGIRFLAMMYESGHGVPLNLAKAAALFAQAADQNDGRAIARLGQLYLRGAGVPRDVGKANALFTQSASLGDSLGETLLARATLRSGSAAAAFTLFSQAAAGGNRVAAFKAGQMLINGKGTPADPVRGVRFLRQSAISGFAPAQRALGKAFEHGIGVKVNLVNAFVLYSLADEQGDLPAKTLLTGVTSRLTPAQLQLAQAALAKWNAAIYGSNGN